MNWQGMNGIGTKTAVDIFLVLAWVVSACEIAVSIALNANMKPICSFTLKGIFCNNSVYKLSVCAQEHCLYIVWSCKYCTSALHTFYIHRVTHDILSKLWRSQEKSCTDLFTPPAGFNQLFLFCYL